MRKIVASIGLAAFGASGVQGASVPDLLGAESPKPWSITATLRGFYDDNINTVKDGDPQKKDALGFEVSPSLAVSWVLPQTTIRASYSYSLISYGRAPADNSGNNYDQTHNFNFDLTHQFSPRYNVNVKDSFVIGQEPDFLRAGNAFTTFQRVSGENIRNAGSITLSAQITRLLELEFGYANAFFDYQDSGEDFVGPDIIPSRSGLNDRFEHTFHLDSRWHVKPQTIGVFGFQFRQVNFTGDEEIAATPSGISIRSQDRDDREYYLYFGVDHTFRPDLTGSVRLGARYIDYYRDPNGIGNGFGPYAQASLHWLYAPESYVEAGASHDINATDELSFGNQNDAHSITLNEESTVFYATINHRITPKLFASLTSDFQNSTFGGGANNNRTERYFLVGLQLEYKFNPRFSAQAGYNYDWLSSDATVNGVISARSFARDRVYIGVTAAY